MTNEKYKNMSEDFNSSNTFNFGLFWILKISKSIKNENIIGKFTKKNREK